MREIWPGTPSPLGATWDGQGVNFALFSEHATRVELCLFDQPDAPRETERIALPRRHEGVWHGYLPGLKPGQLYGYRVYGPYNPERGHRFNPSKLLVDPYARALYGQLRWNQALFGYRLGIPRADLIRSRRDSAPYMPRCVVIDPAFDWGDDRPPRTPLHDTIIYEAHVKGLTKLHPDVPPALRGTYAGLGSPAVVAYLRALGITAIELLPIHQTASEEHLQDGGLTNYWGYSTLGFFAPDVRFTSTSEPGGQVREFKQMVKALHAASIEVILDVVYNHSAEGSHLGPTLSLRGIDNHSYYRLVPDRPRYYMDFTGCGNSLNTLHPRMLQLMMDSLRYWVTEMHVDGFRFDLAVTMARGAYAGDRPSAFFDVIQQDPVLSQVKLIAEPWDVGSDGYRVGWFPPPWAEWNGKYRDTTRRFWKGDEGQLAELASRLTGSSDLYQHNGRSPTTSINFITSHDGFTLRDLVSYNHKHNEANREDNRDGESHNNSWNCGVEGPTDDPAINAMRLRMQRNFLATLFFSQGVPMLLAGDERCRTQRGNNNAYCQDNEISWVDWRSDDENECLLAFTRRLIAIRKQHPILHRRDYFQGRALLGDTHDIEWLAPEGNEMSPHDWGNSHARCLGMLLNGEVIDEQDERGRPVRDHVLLLLLNAHHEQIPFILPDGPAGPCWEVLVDTSMTDDALPSSYTGDVYPLQGRSLALLRQLPLDDSPAIVSAGCAADLPETAAQASARRRSAVDPSREPA